MEALRRVVLESIDEQRAAIERSKRALESQLAALTALEDQVDPSRKRTREFEADAGTTSALPVEVPAAADTTTINVLYKVPLHELQSIFMFAALATDRNPALGLGWQTVQAATTASSAVNALYMQISTHPRQKEILDLIHKVGFEHSASYRANFRNKQ